VVGGHGGFRYPFDSGDRGVVTYAEPASDGSCEMERLRIGVIGLGWFGEIHCETIVGVPSLELAALCTRTPERLSAMAEKFGVAKTYRDYHDLLADPEIDAVSVVTVWDQHTEPAIAALEAGKHVFLEKPMASTVADCQAILAAAKGAKGILLVGHICRFNPRYRMAKQAIEKGTIGTIVSLSSRRNIPAAWTPEILNKIGPIVGDAIHDTDLMLWFTGDTVVSAYAQTVDVRGLKNPDIGQTMYRFAGGATATLETVWCMPERTPFDIDERMTIIGSEGFLHIQDTFPNLGIVSPGGFHSPDTTYWPEFDGVRGGALREEFAYFATCALTGAQPQIGRPEDAMQALAATLAAEESARTGEVVRLGLGE
jgi:UDP-N-acetylglucosamine 3-dehydrogenase